MNKYYRVALSEADLDSDETGAWWEGPNPRHLAEVLLEGQPTELASNKFLDLKPGEQCQNLVDVVVRSIPRTLHQRTIWVRRMA